MTILRCMTDCVCQQWNPSSALVIPSRRAASRPVSERKRPYMSLRRSAATAVISTPAVEEGPIFLGAKPRNLAGNCVRFSVRDQIPPLHDASHHSGRNDGMQLWLFRRKIGVFLRSPFDSAQGKLGRGIYLSRSAERFLIPQCAFVRAS